MLYKKEFPSELMHYFITCDKSSLQHRLQMSISQKPELQWQTTSLSFTH